jgi:hypothetical protein
MANSNLMNMQEARMQCRIENAMAPDCGADLIAPPAPEAAPLST